jgi:hypothetical protein
LPEKVRILKRDRGNLNIDTCYQSKDCKWLCLKAIITL